MIMRIIKQAGRRQGKVMWDCELKDGSRIALSMNEIMCFNRTPG